MKGYWHIIALSACMAILSIVFQQLVFGFMILLAWLFWIYHKQRLNKWQLFSCLLCFFSFIILYHDHPPKSPSILPNTSSIDGQIKSAVTQSNQKIEFVIQMSHKHNVLITYFKNEQHIGDTFDGKIRRGAVCSVSGNLEKPPQSSNPGEFDFQRYLLQQGISYQIIVDNLDQITCTGSTPLFQLDHLRDKLIHQSNLKLSRFTSSWLLALILGDDSQIQDDTIALFQRWSLSHLLAISGLHVGLLVVIFYFFLVKCNILTKEKARILLIILLPVYAVIAGEAPSVWRATMMAALGLLLLHQNIKLNVTDILSIIFLLFIFVDPYMIYQLGFQFSFLITLSLLLSRKIFQLSSLKIYTGFAISFISQLLIFPLQLYNFYFINPLSIILNILVVPYFSIIVIPMMLLCMMITLLIPTIAGMIDSLFMIIHSFFLSGLSLIDDSLYFPWILGKFPIYLFIPYYTAVVLCFASLTDRKLWKAFFYGCCCTLLLCISALVPYVNRTGDITILDIGQGDTIVVELPNRKGVFIIDAAGSMEADFETPSNQVYDQVIKPFLYSRGITHLNAVMLTHADHDHIGSVPNIITEFTVDSIVVSPYFQFTPQVQHIVEKQQIAVETVHQGDKLLLAGQQFTVLSPGSDQGNNNANSLVLYSEFGDKSWLFTGDIGQQEEHAIIATYPELQTDVLKVAHHGSNTSTSDRFLMKVNPEIAIISVGAYNQYGHPHHEIVDRIAANRIVTLRTDKHGAIIYRFDGNSGTFYSFLP